MKLEKDRAIIETAEEAVCIASVSNNVELETCDPGESIEIWVGIGSDWKRKVILKATTPKEGDAVFLCHDAEDFNAPPEYERIYNGPYRGFTVIKANALTIGKTVGELRKLLAWAKDNHQPGPLKDKR